MIYDDIRKVKDFDHSSVENSQKLNIPKQLPNPKAAYKAKYYDYIFNKLGKDIKKVENFKLVCRIFRNTIFRKRDEANNHQSLIYAASFIMTDNRFDFKPLNFQRKQQVFKVITSLLQEGYREIVHLDYLGNIKKVQNLLADNEFADIQEQ